MSYSTHIDASRLPPVEARMRQLDVATNRKLPVYKVIWTSFDYTTGPIFNFSLKLNYVENEGYHESAVSSTTADVSSDPDQYEDIDDPQFSLLYLDDTVPPDSDDDEEEHGSSCHTTVRDGTSNDNLPASTVVSPVGNMEISAVDSGFSTNHSIHSELNQDMSNSQHPFGEDAMLTINHLREDNFNSEFPQAYVSPCRPTTPSPWSKPTSPEEEKHNMSFQDQNAVFTDILNDPTLYDVTDEDFITRHATSEQITGQFISCNPVVMKMCVVPSRQLFYVSYISWPGVKYGPAMTAVTLLMDFRDEKWYHTNKTIIDKFFDDFLMIFTCRIERFFLHERQCLYLSQEIEHFTHVLSAVEENNIYLIQPNDTLLLTEDKLEHEFILRCITGAIMSRGHTYIQGVDDFEYARKLIATLMSFLPNVLRGYCSSMCASRLNCYTLLQLVVDKEKDQLTQQAMLCDWPPCIIDIRKRGVYVTGMYWDHVKESRKYKIAALNNVLENKDLPPIPKTKLIHVRAMPSLYRKQLNMVRQVDPIPLISHFHKLFTNQATTFIQTVEQFSMPSSTNKENPYSSKFSLNRVFEACQITSFEAKGIVMANAENLKPSLSQFIVENAAEFQ